MQRLSVAFLLLVGCVGFAFSAAKNALILGTADLASPRVRTKYHFYHVRVANSGATAHTTPVGSFANQPNKDSYAGWFKTASPSGDSVYRLGFADPTTSTGPGIGITTLNGTVKVDFVPVQPLASFGWYQTIAVAHIHTAAASTGALLRVFVSRSV